MTSYPENNLIRLSSALRSTSAGKANFVSRANSFLSVLFLATLPICSVDLTFLGGDAGMNLGMPIFLLLAPLSGLLVLPFPFVATSKNSAETLVRMLFFFFLWCALTTVATGAIFSYEGITAYGVEPIFHSLARLPIPLLLGAVVVVSFQIAARTLRVEIVERVLLGSAVVVAGYGLVQLVFGHSSPAWYVAIVRVLEAGRNRPALWPPELLNYVAQTGRLNLSTFEPAEAARLLLILFIPVLATPASGGKLRPWRLALIGFMVFIVCAAQSIVGLAGLAVLAVMAVYLLRGRKRAYVLLASGVILIVGWFAMPESFSERFSGISGITNQATEIDESSITRAAFAVASVRVALDHPLLGVGWSKDLFFLPAAVPSWGDTWEIRQCIAGGQALAAKSMVVRLMLYAGFPAFTMIVLVFVRTFRDMLRRFRHSRDPIVLRAIVTLVMFSVCGTLDGGLITAFYSWAALGLAMGLASRHLSGRLDLTAELPSRRF